MRLLFFQFITFLRQIIVTKDAETKLFSVLALGIRLCNASEKTIMGNV